MSIGSEGVFELFMYLYIMYVHRTLYTVSTTNNKNKIYADSLFEIEKKKTFYRKRFIFTNLELVLC